MIKISENKNLSFLNTFGINATVRYFAEIAKEEEIAELFSRPEFKNNPKMFLGGGSNVLFTADFPGIIIQNKLEGIEITWEDADSIFVRAMGGELWHKLVLFAAEKNYWGIENLSFIPGTVGAAPMQNIGAYGAELRNTLVNVEAYSIETGEKKIFTRAECKLGYRESIFKKDLKNKYFITAVALRLGKKGQPNTSYKILANYLKEHGITAQTSLDIAEAVKAIRQSKLPDPKILGNAGSFFKNVFVTKEQLSALQKRFPDMPFFEEDDSMKIPAGWLIEQAGWKGYREGRVGVHEKQALVLVNYGGATGEEVLALAKKVIASIKEKFGLELQPEVNIV